MSRSSASDGGSKADRQSTHRGQVEPFAALAAVLAVGMAISLYATVLSDVHGRASVDGNAEAVLSDVRRYVSDGSVVHPDRVREAPTVVPAGYEANVTLTVAGDRWQVGPTPPESTERASRRVSVRLAPGKVRPGRLTVVIWT